MSFRRIGAPLAAWLACAGAFVLLALVAYGIDSAQHADATLLARMAAHQGSRAGSIADLVVHLGDPVSLLAMLAVACGIAIWRGRPRDALAAAVVVAGANVTTQVLKIALAHPRYNPVLGADQLGPVAFPSGHVTAAASIAIAFAFVVPAGIRPLVAAIGACLVAGVGISVAILAWHYPSDALGGVLVACGWGFAVLAALRAVEGEPRSRAPAQPPSRAAISVK